MNAHRQQLGPYSRSLRRGAIGASLDGRSEAGRYARDLERQLIEHAGGNLTITQKMLVDRIVKTALQLRALDEKFGDGTGWTDCDSRTHNGLVNRQRLMLRELGFKASAAAKPALLSPNDLQWPPRPAGAAA